MSHWFSIFSILELISLSNLLRISVLVLLLLSFLENFRRGQKSRNQFIISNQYNFYKQRKLLVERL
jgi:hypothetical protein